MAPVTITRDTDAQQCIRRGISTLARIVAPTMGPQGKNVLVEQPFAAPLILRAGHKIAEVYEPRHPLERIGGQMMRDLTWSIYDDHGDGTSSAIILMESLLESCEHAASNQGGQKVADELAQAAQRLVASIRQRCRAIQSLDQIEALANTAAQGQEAISSIIAEAYRGVGLDGLVLIEKAPRADDQVSISAGFGFDGGLACKHPDASKSRIALNLANVAIAVSRDPVVDHQPVIRLMELCASLGRDLLLLAPDISGQALAVFNANAASGDRHYLAVKLPEVADWRMLAAEDIAIHCGATVFGIRDGVLLDNATASMLGSAENVRIDTGFTAVTGGKGDPESRKLRVAEIQRAIEREKYLSYDREQHRKRLARMTSGVATVRIGGVTTTEQLGRLSLARQANRAVQSALKGGIVNGAAADLMRACREARSERPASVGDKILEAALRAPFRKVVENAGLEPGLALDALLKSDDGWFDVRSGCLQRNSAFPESAEMTIALIQKTVSLATTTFSLGAALSRPFDNALGGR